MCVMTWCSSPTGCRMFRQDGSVNSGRRYERPSPAGRVFVVDEIEDAWRHEVLREEFVVGPSVPVVNRSLADGRRFRVVKQFWNPAELRAAVLAMGWEAEVHPAGPLFWAEAVRR